jgi:hypothetical protein
MFRPSEFRKTKGLECLGETFTHSSKNISATIPPMPMETSYRSRHPGIPSVCSLPDNHGGLRISQLLVTLMPTSSDLMSCHLNTGLNFLWFSFITHPYLYS